MARPARALADDGLPAPSVGNHAEEKYKLVTLYAQLFARAMGRKWSMSYIDLFAGAGRCRIGDSQRLALTSPTRILGLDVQFDRYVFCDLDEEAASALRVRAARDFPDREVRIHQGDANTLAMAIAAQIPPRGTLSFCFLDPYRMDNLQFSTVAALATRRIDFLVLIPSGMDGNRNESIYVKSKDKHVERFCGAADWRHRWASDKGTNLSFGDFIAKEFGRSMATLDYIDPGLSRSHPVRMDEKNVLLYRLALYSKHELGAKFWTETKRYAVPQLNFGFN